MTERRPHLRAQSRELPQVPRTSTGKLVVILVATAVVLTAAIATAGSLILAGGGGLVALAGVMTLVTAGFAVGYLVCFLRTPRGAPEVLEHDGATVLVESRAAQVTAWGTLAAMLAALSALVAAAFASGGSDGTRVGVLGLLFVLVLAAPTVPGVRGRRLRRGELVLTPHALTLRTWNTDRTLAWDDVHRVVLLASPRRTLAIYTRDKSDIVRGRHPLVDPLTVEIPGAGRALAVSFTHLVGDPGAIAGALEHWRRVPRDRHELGTPAARRRLL